MGDLKPEFAARLKKIEKQRKLPFADVTEPMGLEIDEKLSEKFRKLGHKDKKQLTEIGKKIEQILENPHHFEHLEQIMKHFHRVHVDGSFVLIYSIDENRNVVTLHEYDHHDNIYRHPHLHTK